GPNVFHNLRNSISLRLRTQIAFAMDAHRDSAGILLFLADDEHRVHFGDFRIANFATDLIAGTIQLGADALRLEFVGDTLRIVNLGIANRQHPDLFGREPERKISGKMLDQDSDEAFETPKRRAMNHHWSMPLIIGSHILELEAFRQIVIE